MRKATMPAIIAMTATPPTTPPAIAPALLLLVGVGVGVIGVVDGDVTVDGVGLVGGLVVEGDFARLSLDYCWSEHNDKDTYMTS
jgi:hypothetical protein